MTTIFIDLMKTHFNFAINQAIYFLVFKFKKPSDPSKI